MENNKQLVDDDDQSDNKKESETAQEETKEKSLSSEQQQKIDALLKRIEEARTITEPIMDALREKKKYYRQRFKENISKYEDTIKQLQFQIQEYKSTFEQEMKDLHQKHEKEQAIEQDIEFAEMLLEMFTDALKVPNKVFAVELPANIIGKESKFVLNELFGGGIPAVGYFRRQTQRIHGFDSPDSDEEWIEDEEFYGTVQDDCHVSPHGFVIDKDQIPDGFDFDIDDEHYIASDGDPPSSEQVNAAIKNKTVELDWEDSHKVGRTYKVNWEISIYLLTTSEHEDKEEI